MFVYIGHWLVTKHNYLVILVGDGHYLIHRQLQLNLVHLHSPDMH